MRSDEVLREVIHEAGVKRVAAELKLSRSLVYKWCQPKEDPDDSGADNPLDRLSRLMEITSNKTPLQWLCERSGGYFVANPNVQTSAPEAVLDATQRLLAEFSEMLGAVSKSYGDDNSIDPGEAAHIRKEWEDLKQLAESFVSACERGVFSDSPDTDEGS